MPHHAMEPEDKLHRRTNSESSKIKKAGVTIHVKGKRKAPQPPGAKVPNQSTATMSLKRKKRLAPLPPPNESHNDADNDEIMYNDSLKLDHGVLKGTKEAPKSDKVVLTTDVSVSPKLWYKRASSNLSKYETKSEPPSPLPEVQFKRNSAIDFTVEITRKTEDKQPKSGMAFLTNISELDREATELLMKSRNGETQQPFQEMPPFMRPKVEEPKVDQSSWVSPKRRSAKDLIAKFNAITSVTKATVFGVPSSKEGYFGKKQHQQEAMLESHKKRIEEIDKKKTKNNLAKSESVTSMKKPDTPKSDRKSWNCPKCSMENEYWRIICYVCSAIKPYFDDLTTSGSPKKIQDTNSKPSEPHMLPLERSRTQIAFPALAALKSDKMKKFEKSVSLDEKVKTKSAESKEEEREKLKKMLIEMKNSLPKCKPYAPPASKQQERRSIIVESPEEVTTAKEDQKDEVKGKAEAVQEVVENKENKGDPSQKNQIAEAIVVTTEVIYENIKMKKADNPKPAKVSSSAQTNSVVKKPEPSAEVSKDKSKGTKAFELLGPKDFETIYNDANSKSAKIYANLAKNDNLSLYFNMPKNFNDMQRLPADASNTDTMEINRLLKKLEDAIAKGQLTEASIYAKELAQLKISCSVVRQKPQNNDGKDEGFMVEMYVEDKSSHRGPFCLRVTETQTVAQLKQQVEKEFDIPRNVQKWILGNRIASDETATLKSHYINREKCPIFLYLVAPIEPSSNLKIGSTSQPILDEATPSTSTSFAVKLEPTKGANIEKSVDNQNESKIKEDHIKIEASGSAMPQISKPKENVPPLAKASFLETPKPKASTTFNVIPETVEELHVEDYDSKTLLPQATEWECHLCTLLNPITSNVCAACAAVKLKGIVLNKIVKKTPQRTTPHTNQQTYHLLVNLDNTDLVENVETFECVVCFLNVPPGEGITLRECLHQFCKICLAHTVEYTEDAEVKCPYRDDQYSCNIALQDREIKALVTPQVYDQYLTRSMSEAESKIGKSFHCKTPDCKGWCIFEDNVNEFRCPVCRRTNCLTCQAIHIGMNCKQYQERQDDNSEMDADARRTKDMLEKMVSKGEALTCPTCQVILLKKWGCDWVRCSMCKTEICWVTRGPRWGPGGKGDTSGGCQCGVNGVKCHPQCSYCH